MPAGETEPGMFEFTGHGVRLAFIDEHPAPGDRGEPILLIHGFASTHAVSWVFPQWVKTLTGAGRRVIAFDNRGHGRSEKFYDPAAYALPEMAEDARALLDHLHIEVADVMGYSMGARIAAFLQYGAGDRCDVWFLVRANQGAPRTPSCCTVWRRESSTSTCCI